MPLIETKGAASAQGFGEFSQSSTPAYIEDVFSTYLYTGNGSTQTITNGIDLSGKGGLVWLKGRSAATNHFLFDTSRGVLNELNSNNTEESASLASSLTAFNTSGFALGSAAGINVNAATYASWTFRKQAKFFDVVTYTGTGSNRTVAHNLGSVPGCIIVKRTDGGGTLWAVYHRSLGATQDIALNSTSAAGSSTLWNSTAPTSTQFTVGTLGAVNASGGTYVAYLFAHNAGGFGLSGSDNVISCGSFTTDGSGNADVTLGYEPQWLLVKAASDGSSWALADSMRGMPVSGNGSRLFAQSDSAESSASWWRPNATGFTSQALYAAGTTVIYIAIRRGPMKVPTSGTSVFSPIARTGTSAAATVTVGFPVDMVAVHMRNAANNEYVADRLRGGGLSLEFCTTGAETDRSAGGITSIASNTGFSVGIYSDVNSSPNTYINWCFRRAPGFFDVVCYTGTGAGQVVSHNLGVVPQLMIFKCRSTSGTNWIVTNAFTGYMSLNLTTARDSTTPWDFNGTAPTSTQLTTRAISNLNINSSGSTYVAYLFATVAGVSKVGTYTGTGTTLQIDCGFTGGARFILIKRTDSTGDWYVWDSARGIVASTDPYLVLNSTAAEVTTTDWVDTYSAGFELSSAAGNNVNINAASYIFLSIA